MNDVLSVQVKNNSIWVQKYDRHLEKEFIKELFSKNYNWLSKQVNIIDVGCGNGRSAILLHEILGDNAIIHGIDKCKANVCCAQQLIINSTITFEFVDAFNFFEHPCNQKKFDIAFFSWSLFDMCDELDFTKKELCLQKLIEMVQRSLTPHGMIIVLQPTKGGIFEKLLSKFMPGSDADYEMVHNFLIKSGFDGARSAFPTQNDKWTIWSKFSYNSSDEIFLGVSSILYLEQKQTISREFFDKVFFDFLKEHDIGIENLELTDCVNLYYKFTQ